MGKPIPITAGIYMGADPIVRVRYPLNMVFVPGQDGVADGHLKPAEGISTFGVALGVDRAAIVWTGAGNGVHYRVSGSRLVSVSSTGVVTDIGAVEGTNGFARMDFSFTQLGILSNGFLWYSNGGAPVKVTDPNIPAALTDMVWLDGYFLVTDGTNIAASDLVTPTTFNPAKFGTTDRPDPVQCLLKVLNQLVVVSRNSIDVFRNTGGTGFPFTRLSSAPITRGAVGRAAACEFNDTVAFVGNGRKEEPSVYLGWNGRTVKIGTTEIDNLLAEYTAAQLATVVVESMFTKGTQLLFVHLPDRTAVYDAIASAMAEQPVWHLRTSGLEEFGQYRARNMVRAGDAWVVGDPQSAALGTFSATDSQHYGEPTRWEFSTLMLRVGNTGATMHALELLGLTGSVTFETVPRISTSYSANGRTFGRERFIESGAAGDLDKRLRWFRLGTWRKYRIHRFRGDSASRLSVLSLDADISPLRY